ncbi:MAG: M48 family metallopeptidase [Thermoplasmata archaeon]|nr:MAG: M48 family metallopeptidase [Thermoplasmata archaeon]
MIARHSSELTELYQNIWDGFSHKKGRQDYEIRVEYYPYTTLKNTIRRRGNSIFVRISDLLEDAPEEVIRALGIIMFCRLERRRAPESEDRLYRDHVHSKEVQDRLRNLRRKRSKKVLFGPKGRFYHLNESFDRINMNYFNGDLKRPHLSWNSRKTRTRFGHHDDALNTIVISRTLDDDRLPRYLLDFVMYHEALHIKHKIKYQNGRRDVHSKAFKSDEKKFLGHKKAKALLKNLSKGSIGG